MGLGDTTSNILLRFKADTKQAKAELRGLTKEQQKAAKQSIAAMEAQNKKIDGHIEKITKIGVAVGSVVVAYKAATGSIDFFAKRSQLMAASAGADIDAIQRAAQGLITKQEALQFAAAAMNTEFKLSQQQMEQVARFMIVLRNQGNDLEQVQKKLTQAIVEGNSRALREFGVIVDGSTGKLETQQKILAEITKQNELYAGSLELAGDAALRSKVTIGDAWDYIAEKTGNAISAAVKYVDKINEALDAIEESRRLSGDEEIERLAKALVKETYGKEHLSLEQARRRVMETYVRPADRDAAEVAWIKSLTAEEKAAIREARKSLGKLVVGTIGDALRSATGLTGESGSYMAFSVEEAEAAQREYEKRRGSRRGGGKGAAGAGMTFSVAEAAAAEQEDLRRLAAEAAGFGGADAGTVMRLPEVEQVHAITVEFEKMAISIGAVEGALDAFTMAGEAAFRALVTGSDGVAAAFKKAFAEGLLGLGAEMFGRALYHSAMAIGSAAMGNMPAAGTHATAAAKFAAGAAATGLMARALGAGASPTPGGGGAAAGLASGGFGIGAGAGGGTREVIILGTDTIDDDVRGKRRRMRELMDAADRELGGGRGQIVRA